MEEFEKAFKEHCDYFGMTDPKQVESLRLVYLTDPIYGATLKEKARNLLEDVCAWKHAKVVDFPSNERAYAMGYRISINEPEL